MALHKHTPAQRKKILAKKAASKKAPRKKMGRKVY